MVSHAQVPAEQAKNTFRGEKEVGRAIVNKEFMAFHWLNPCQEEDKMMSLFVGICYHHRA